MYLLLYRIKYIIGKYSFNIIICNTMQYLYNTPNIYIYITAYVDQLDKA